MSEQPDEHTEDGRPPFDAIFPQLVNKDSPGQKLLGFIAYGLYQDAKREWISAFRHRETRYPVAEEVRAYERSWTASRLEALGDFRRAILRSIGVIRPNTNWRRPSCWMPTKRRLERTHR
jgi:hypothetical protein